MHTTLAQRTRHFRNTGSFGSLAIVTAKSWWHERRRRYRIRATARILHGLSDRGLKDIGIDRSQIESTVRALDTGRTLRQTTHGFRP